MDFKFTGARTQIVTEKQLQLAASIISIGAFDGVHLGHQKLIKTSVTEARQRGIASVIYTFDPPPKVFFGRALQLSSLSDKLARIAQLGPDYIVVASFNKTYCNRSAEAFVNDLAHLTPHNIHVGEDFRFGCKQSGDINLLSQHYNVTLANPVLCKSGNVVSSTRIRNLLSNGKRFNAAELQGCPGTAALMAGRLQSTDMRLDYERHF